MEHNHRSTVVWGTAIAMHCKTRHLEHLIFGAPAIGAQPLGHWVFWSTAFGALGMADRAHDSFGGLETYQVMLWLSKANIYVPILQKDKGVIF